MADSGTKTGSNATCIIKVDGSIIPDEHRVLSVRVEKKVNGIPVARIVILDGEAETGKFSASSSSTFVPGAQLTIQAGYESGTAIIFKGIITQQSIRINDEVGSALEIECRDNAIKMTVGRKCLSYSQQTDSDIISSIIGNYSGLTSKVSSTTTKWPEQVQYYATDWDFILTRAEVNGMIVIPLDGKVTVAPPDADTSSVLTVKYGDGLYEFSADLNAVMQLGTVKASTWDYKNQQVSSGQSSSHYAGAGNLTTEKLSQVIGVSPFMLRTSGPLENDDLKTWSKSQLIKSEYSKIQGEAKIDGTSIVAPGKYITLAGVGDRFNGNHLVSGVVHEISDGDWFTIISIGLSPLWFVEEPDVMSAAASGLLPAARGLFNGTVKKIFDDPDTQYRILVDIPMFDSNGAGIWARLSNFYSTNNAGIFFLPEIGDEVVIGFLNEDPRYPIILGSMYSSPKLKPFAGQDQVQALEPNEKNQYKAITSQSGITIQFDDVNKVITCATPASNYMIFSDKDKQISVKDQNGNSIVMSESGITLNSPKDINITAEQNITISGKMGVKIQSSGGDVEISGINIKETAQAQYTATGNATAQINGGAELTVKAAMVLIN